MADDDAIVTLYGGMSRDEMLTNLLWWRSQAERNVQPPLTVAALQSRIAELEAVLRALAQAVREQDDAIDPSSKLMQALRDAESWI